MALSALIPAAAGAHPWSVGAGFETDDTDTHIAAADLFWSPADSLALSVGAGVLKSSGKEGNFNARTGSIVIDWSPVELFSAALGYNVWDDRDNFDKDTVRGALYFGSETARIGAVAESVHSQAKAELVLPRRRIKLDFDGWGYGLDASFARSRFAAYASYIGYHYGPHVDRLIAFLSNPAFAKRPRLQALVDSGLTAAGALLHRSVIAGTDIFVGERRIGLAWSQFHEILTDTRTDTLHVELEWPVSRQWTAQLTVGASKSQGFGTIYFAGTRFSLHGL
jgi:hypothetical protein